MTKVAKVIKKFKVAKKIKRLRKLYKKVLNKKLPELTLPNLIRLLDRQPDEQETLKEIHKELTDVLKRLSEVNGHNRNLIEQSLEMISYNMNLLQSTRIVPGNNYTRNAGQWDMTASQTGMFDAKQ